MDRTLPSSQRILPGQPRTFAHMSSRATRRGMSRPVSRNPGGGGLPDVKNVLHRDEDIDAVPEQPHGRRTGSATRNEPAGVEPVAAPQRDAHLRPFEPSHLTGHFVP